MLYGLFDQKSISCSFFCLCMEIHKGKLTRNQNETDSPLSVDRENWRTELTQDHRRWEVSGFLKIFFFSTWKRNMGFFLCPPFPLLSAELLGAFSNLPNLKLRAGYTNSVAFGGIYAYKIKGRRRHLMKAVVNIPSPNNSVKNPCTFRAHTWQFFVLL